jgi:hypothetical protein
MQVFVFIVLTGTTGLAARAGIPFIAMKIESISMKNIFNAAGIHKE